jgi:hypothetical protein
MDGVYARGRQAPAVPKARAIIAMVYERFNEPLMSRYGFYLRLLRHIAVAVLVLAGSLVIGVIGYLVFAHLSPVDAFLNAAMILGGMGPVDPLPDDAAKIFAGLYALYSGVIFLVVAGLVLAPILHRVLHYLHLPTDDDDADAAS